MTQSKLRSLSESLNAASGAAPTKGESELPPYLLGGSSRMAHNS